ncbi:polyketide synthase, partial [Mycolicibacter hiberniae]|uniref:beta-ketoacyl synthase N-terminal-like domain-containing protein n=1 Tax=Mycolicibacter hiberniae TaxID=29314 RepID=UPI0023DE97ED
MSAADADPVVISIGLVLGALAGFLAQAFWNALADGSELIGPFPRDRDWPIEQLLSLSNLEGWGRVSDAGGFLTDASAFDPTFYG